MDNGWIAVIYTVGYLVFLTYVVSAALLMVLGCRCNGPGRVINAVWKWSKWPAFGYVLARPVLDVLILGNMSWWETLVSLLNGYIWWSTRDAGDDDFTKKMKKMLKEKIEVVEGKLVVVPELA